MLKKIILIIILFFCFSLSLDAFIQRRQFWWEKKISNLKTVSKSEKIKQDPLLIDLLNQEIKEANEFIKIFNPYSLQKEKIFKEKEIKQKLKLFYDSAYSLFLLNYGFNHLNSVELDKITEKIIQKELNRVYKKHFNDISKEEVIYKYKLFFSANDYKYLKLEILMGTLINNYEKQKKDLFDNLLNKIKKTDLLKNKISEYQLNKKLSKIVTDHFLTTSFNELFMPDRNALIKSWVWENNLIKINHELNLLIEIKNILNSFKEKNSYNKIKFYFNNPFKFEEKIFKKYYNYYYLTNAKIKLDKKSDIPVKINIPETPDLNNLFEKINSLRKQTVKEITGYEKKPEINRIAKNFYRLKNQTYKLSNSLFLLEENKLKKYLNSAKESSEEETEKRNNQFNFYYGPFYSALEIQKRKKRNTNLYIKKNIQFIKWIVNKRKTDFYNFDIVLNNIFNRNKQYINFLILLENQASEAYLLKNNNLKARYLGLINQEKHFLKALKYSSSHYEILLIKSGLNTEKIKKLKDENKKFQNYLVASQKEIIDLKKQYNQNLKKSKTENKAFLKSHKKEIAQKELELILNNLFLYYNTFEKLDYSKTVFEKYLLAYKKLYRQTTQGIISEDLKKIINKRSIFPLIKKYNPVDFKKHYTAKNYLKNEMLSKLANFYTLLNLYKRRGLVFSCPEMKKLKAIKTEINKRPQIKISSWIMHEKNYLSIDKKAVLLLSKIRDRKSWDKYLKKENFNNKPDQKYTFKKLNISICIPDGWIKRKLLETEKQKGIISFFYNKENKSNIIVAKVPLKASKEKTTDLWLKKSGQRILKIGWGKNKNETYYWNISKDKEKKLMKTFAFKKNENLIIISGESIKFYYPYFENRINAVFNSIQ